MSPAAPVLLAYDGSAGAAQAIASAGRLLAAERALVCHVRARRSDAQEAARVAAEGVELATAAGFHAEPLPVAELRKTWRALVEAADTSHAGVIVAGAHGHSGELGRALLGSVSMGLVHHAPVPVLVVPEPAPAARASGPLLLCYDGSEGAERALTAASGVFRRRDALVLHFWESWVAEAPALAGLSAAVHGMAVELDELAHEQSARRASDGVEHARAAGFEASALSEQALGPPWHAVLDAADEHDCAAIVVGSRGMSGISAALGSVSSGVVHHSRRPVLVVPPARAG